MNQTDGTPISAITRPNLSDGVVRFVGQPVAFVVADTLAAAQDAAELIEVEYEERGAVTDAAARVSL